MEENKPQSTSLRKLLRNFMIEMVLYGALVAVYFLLVLRYLDELLNRYFVENLTLYAVIGLALIVGQAVVLDWVTSFLLDQIKLERLE
jgi:hypothetical protein